MTSRPERRTSGLAGRSPAQPPAASPVVQVPADLEVAAPRGTGSLERNSKRIPPGKVQFTVYVPADLRQEAQDTARALMARAEGPNNLSGLVTEAIARELQRLRDTYNDGERFPHVAGPLPTGRTPGT